MDKHNQTFTNNRVFSNTTLLLVLGSIRQLQTLSIAGCGHKPSTRGHMAILSTLNTTPQFPEQFGRRGWPNPAMLNLNFISLLVC